ncbi:MAG: type IV pilus assembly protein PilK [Halieaceae bacterium]|jgi:type IV pilus assembly protein PilK
MNQALAMRPPVISYELLGELIHQLKTHTGIILDSTPSVISYKVGERMAALGIEHATQYLSIFDNSISARAEWLALTDLLTIKETRFFRQPEALTCTNEYLTGLFAANNQALNEIAFWSAGCSTGQEVYSLSMVVENFVKNQKPWVAWHGIGTDLSFQAVHSAQQGKYSESAISSVPASYRKAFIHAGDGNDYQIAETLRARTHFFHSNLLHVNNAPFADFNIIFCQNVLIYFERATQLWIIDQLCERLRSGGLLVLGAGEDFRWKNTQMQRMNFPGVTAYKKQELN